MSKTLTLNLDSLWEDSYIYTEYDIGGRGHSITIVAEDKESFLDAFAQEWRDRAEGALEEDDEEEQEIINALENDKLYALCINTIEDDGDIQCIKGKKYLVYEINETIFSIDTEDGGSLTCPREDEDFELIING